MSDTPAKPPLTITGQRPVATVARRPAAPRAKSAPPPPGTVVAWFDGGSRGNPGPAAAAAVIELDGHCPVEVARYLGIETNNVAEYNAAVAALEEIASLAAGGARVDEVVLRGDSQLVVRQLSGEWRINEPALEGLAQRCHALIARLGARARFEHVPRAKNRRADRLVNQCLDRQR